MIINIAGTSGSGKSFLIREFIKWVEKNGKVKPLMLDYYKYPAGYDVTLPKSKVIHIVGPYGEADTAGCDVIRNVEEVYDLIHEAVDADKHVIFEGLFMMNMTRGPQMVGEYENVNVIHLADPLATCLASISARRAARGEGELFSKQNTVQNFKRAQNYADKMRSAGATVVRVRRDKALETLVGLLGYDLYADNFGIR